MNTKSITNIIKTNKEIMQAVKQNTDTDTTWTIGKRGNMEAYTSDNTRNTDYDYQPIKQGDYQTLTAIADDEIFKFWNGYFVSNHARVYSTKHNKFITPYIKEKKLGYYYIDLSNNNKTESTPLSNIVAGLFDADFENNRYFGEIIEWDNLEVHHIDKNKANNKADNLVILTSADHKLVHRALRKGTALNTIEAIDKLIFMDRERREYFDSDNE